MPTGSLHFLDAEKVGGLNLPAPTTSSLIQSHSGVATSGVKPKRPLDALQLDGPDLLERHGCPVRRLHDLLAHHHLAGPGVVRDPRREVDRTAEVVTVLEDHRPCVESDVGRWQVVVRDTLGHLEGREHGTTRFPEIEHHSVAEPLHRSAPVFLGGPPDQACQLRRQIRGGLIATLLGQPRVPGDVEEADRRRTVQPTVQTGPAPTRPRRPRRTPVSRRVPAGRGRWRGGPARGRGPSGTRGRLGPPSSRPPSCPPGEGAVRPPTSKNPSRSRRSGADFPRRPGAPARWPPDGTPSRAGAPSPARSIIRLRGRDPRAEAPRSRPPLGPPSGGPWRSPSSRSVRGT